ncbi:MAG: thermonuclease family protein [Verrucomicrobiales bacterium]
MRNEDFPISLSKKTVRIQIKSVDAYNRWVGTIFDEDGHNLNLEMVKSGFAWHYTKYLPDYEEYATAQKTAGLQRKSLWDMPNVMSPWKFRALSPTDRAVEKELAVLAEHFLRQPSQRNLPSVPKNQTRSHVHRE